MTKHASLYLSLINDLNVLNDELLSRTQSDDVDAFFIDNINFFVRSLVITLCSYVESFLKCWVKDYIIYYNSIISNAKIPHNILFLDGELSKCERYHSSFSNFSLHVDFNSFLYDLSSNPNSIKSTFQKIGIDLDQHEFFSGQFEFIRSIVDKRNNIVHHRDNASDISFSDISVYIKVFSNFIQKLDETLTPYNQPIN